jgi:FMN phosphatase YigB (HAD superfamily)
MFSFRQFILERKDPTSSTAHLFDIDDTLFHHDNSKLQVHVKDKKTGERITSLSNQQYNSHKLDPNHEYDYSDFKSSSVFQKTAKPIRSMIAKMKAIHKNNKNVEIVTARADFDDKDKFAHHMKKYGIDIGDIHVRRSGNLDARVRPAVNKAKVISGLIKQEGYKKVHLYDDSHENLDAFKALKDQHPDVEFHAHHVHHDPETGKVTVTHSVA